MNNEPKTVLSVKKDYEGYVIMRIHDYEAYKKLLDRKSDREEEWATDSKEFVDE